MKKRLLLVLPVVAFLAGCGETDPMAEVQKSLPSDVEKIDPAEAEQGEIVEYIMDAVNGVFNIFEDKAVYNVAIDLSSSVSGKENGQAYSSNAFIKGNLSGGYEVVDHNGVNYGSAFLQVTNFTVSADLNLPEALKEEMPIPEHMAISNANFYACIVETHVEDKDVAFAFFDLSDHSIQDYVKTTLLANEMPEAQVDLMLDVILGEKEEGEQYRPGKVHMNLSYILETLDEHFVALGKESIGEEAIAHPVLYFLEMAQDEATVYQQQYANMAMFVLASLNATIGIKEEAVEPSEGAMVGLDKVSLVLNISSAQVAEMMGVAPETIPVNGVAGLLISVGMDNGEEKDYALEELSLSVNLTYSEPDMNVAARGSVSLTASYNQEAEMVYPSSEELTAYVDITDTVLDIIGNIIGLA